MSVEMKTLTIDGVTYAPVDVTARTADGTVFSDGETFQQKFNNGSLTGPAGADGKDGEMPLVTATSTDGAAYTATVDGMNSLVVGKEIMIIPNTNSTVVNPTLNVNNLGAKQLRCSTSTNNATTTTGPVANWLYNGKPVKVRWNGTFWVTDIIRMDATALYNSVPVEKGGTGATTAEAALENLGVNAAISAAIGDAIGGSY